MADLERMQRDKATILSIIKYILVTAIAALAIYIVLRFFIILLPFVFGFILARVAVIIVNSLYRGFHRHRPVSVRHPSEMQQTEVSPGDRHVPEPGLAETDAVTGQMPREPIRKGPSLVIYFLLITMFIAMLVGVIVVGIGQLRNLVNYLPDLVRDTDLINRLIQYLSDLSDRLGGLLQPSQLALIQDALTGFQQNLLAKIPDVVTAILNGIGAFAASMPVVFFIIIVVIMSGYYFISDNRNMYRFLKRNITSNVFWDKTVQLIDTLSSALFRLIGGYLLLFIFTFLFSLGGLAILGMPYAVIFALLIAFLDLLPILGLGAGLIPISIYFFFTGNLLGGIGTLVLLALMSFIRRFIEPPILGNAMSLHPMATLISMVIGIAFYGITGFLIGPVVLLVAKETLSLYGLDHKLRSLFGDILTKVSS